VLLLDALGAAFLERHHEHPLVHHLDVTPLRSQFPSTTTAHVTTMHFGLPVEDHGLYEWNILEPALDTVICPLRYTTAGSDGEGALAAWLDPAVLAPGPTFYESLGVPSLVLQPDRITDSTFTRLATRGANVKGFDSLPNGIQLLTDSLGARPEIQYAFLYWDVIDAVGHQHGPSTPAFHAAVEHALDFVWHGLCNRRDLTVLMTADHGQVDVSPERIDYLDDLWPELPALLSQPRPAGSSRDAFLHVRAEHRDDVIEGLAARLGDRAEVLPAPHLFDALGPRLRSRLGDIAVLPAPGRQVWLRRAAANERWFRGQHGGLHEDETRTYLATLTAS
jgi:predicted AlkP superfamily pyrophosphatase or phosphodiesterase